MERLTSSIFSVFPTVQNHSGIIQLLQLYMENEKFLSVRGYVQHVQRVSLVVVVVKIVERGVIPIES